MNRIRKTPRLAPLALIISLSVLPLACGGGGGGDVIPIGPSIRVSVSANPTTVTAPGGTVTFTVMIGADGNSATINSLVDSIYGNLTQATNSTCTLSQSIQAGGTYSCTFQGAVNGSAGFNQTNTVTASGSAGDGTAVSASGSTTVGVTGSGGLQATFDGAPAGADPSISMADDNSAGATFKVDIMVSGISDLFGAAFRVTFDSSTAAFDGSSSTNSVLVGGGATTNISAVLAPGKTNELIVTATRFQSGTGSYVPSVDASSPSLLITLNFTATGITANNAFNFGPASQREVETCNNTTETCSMVGDATLSWTGGNMSASP